MGHKMCNHFRIPISNGRFPTLNDLFRNPPGFMQQPVQALQQEQNIWTNPVNNNDQISVSNLYNVEQIHATYLVMLQKIALNPETMKLLVDSPNDVFKIFNTEIFRNQTRNLLAESTNFVNHFKSGTEESLFPAVYAQPVQIDAQPVQIDAQPVQLDITPVQIDIAPLQETLIELEQIPQLSDNDLNQVNPINLNDMDPRSLDMVRNILLSMMNTDGSLNSNLNEFDDEYEGDNDDGDGDVDGDDDVSAVDDNTILSPEDQKNIEELIVFTGIDENTAKLTYLACGRDNDLASEMILKNR
jgi:hypothetical protein